MPDVVGYRAKVGVIVPSTNTVVEHDLNLVRPPGVTFHSGRFLVDSPALDSDDAFLALLEGIRKTIPLAVRDVMTCFPDYLIMGMSAETFWGGKIGAEEFEADIRIHAGDIGITLGATACAAALERLGVSSIACLTPYQPIGDEQVHGFFTELGYDVKRVIGLKSPSATAIADEPPEKLIEQLKALDGSDVEAIIQCGTNLSMVQVADQAEAWLGKPVLAINAVCLWHALRAMGFDDRFIGHGMILRDF